MAFNWELKPQTIVFFVVRCFVKQLHVEYRLQRGVSVLYCIGTYMCQTHCYIVQVLIRYVCWEVKGHCTMYISSLHQLNTCRSVYTLLTVTVPVKFLGTVISQGLIAKFSWNTSHSDTANLSGLLAKMVCSLYRTHVITTD